MIHFIINPFAINASLLNGGKSAKLIKIIICKNYYKGIFYTVGTLISKIMRYVNITLRR